MSIALYLIPFIIAFVSAGLLFLDHKKTNLLAAGIVIILTSLGAAITSTMLLNSAGDTQSAQQQKIAFLEDWKERQIARLHGILAQFRPQAEETTFKMHHFASLGWDIKNYAFIQSLTADQARERLIEELPKKHFISKPVLIKNLPDDIDQLIVAQALEELGFLVDLPMPSTETVETADSAEAEEKENEGEGESGSKESKESDKKRKIKDKDKDKAPEIKRINVMYYGSYVKTHEIKLIALTMMRAGINLKLIRLSKQNSGEAARSVIFDWSKTYTTRPSLSPLEIYKKASFRR